MSEVRQNTNRDQGRTLLAPGIAASDRESIFMEVVKHSYSEDFIDNKDRIKELCFEHQSAGIIFGLQEVQSLRTLAEEIVFSNLPKNTTVFTAASTGPLNELYAV